MLVDAGVLRSGDDFARTGTEKLPGVADVESVSRSWSAGLCFLREDWPEGDVRVAAGERATEALVAAVRGLLSTSVAAAAFLFLVSGGVVEAFCPWQTGLCADAKKRQASRWGRRDLFFPRQHTAAAYQCSKHLRRGGGGGGGVEDEKGVGMRDNAALALSRSLRG